MQEVHLQNEADEWEEEMNTELHHRTVEVLSKLVDVLTCDELSLLCWNCGVSVTDLMPVEDCGTSTGTFAAYIEKENSHVIHY